MVRVDDGGVAEVTKLPTMQGSRRRVKDGVVMICVVANDDAVDVAADDACTRC